MKGMMSNLKQNFSRIDKGVGLLLKYSVSRSLRAVKSLTSDYILIAETAQRKCYHCLHYRNLLSEPHQIDR